ncbi:DUF1294 domain-containing protein [Colwellia piezophila]|uniref:DUF1294 domain-containing protein n=1 Tax=Colwellia piezophila TaxID=211668 RepID=UPI0003612015|nr:DUF1294 domain-containing protein [Colwellia piezophila]
MQNNKTKNINKLSIYLSIIFIGIITVAYFNGQLPPQILWLYLGASTISFFAYALDKSRAKRGKWRIPENTLHLLALIGGWPGAAVAQEILRHKSKKVPFRAAFWLTVIANTVALTWLMTPQAQSFLTFFPSEYG